LEIILLLSMLALLLVSALSFRKIVRVDKEVWQLRSKLEAASSEAELRLYRQIEALIGIYRVVDPVRPLPPMRGWAGSPDFLMELLQTLLRTKPVSIVECSSGVSTLICAYCCRFNGAGHVQSLEHDPLFAAATRRNLAEHGLTEWATVIDAPLTDVAIGGESYRWYRHDTVAQGAIDLLVVDGPPAGTGPMARFPAGPLLFPYMRKGGAILLDDAGRPDEKVTVERWLELFPRLALRMPAAEKGMAVLSMPVA
jgi:hypothetical protein